MLGSSAVSSFDLYFFCLTAFGTALPFDFLGSNRGGVAIKVAELPNPDSNVYPMGLAFNSDGSRVAVKSYSEKRRTEQALAATVYVWDWRSTHIEKALDMPIGFGSGLGTNPISYDQDGGLLAVCDGKGGNTVVARIWNTRNWVIERDIDDPTPGGCNSIGFYPSAREILYVTDSIGKSDNNLIAFGEDKWQQDWAIRVPASSLASIAVSPDGQLAAVSGTTYVRSNGETSRAYIYIVSLPEHKVTKAIPITEVGTLAWTADGKRVAIAGGPGIELVDFFTEKTRRTDDLKDAHRMSVRFTSDGLYCVESVENGATGLGVRIWDGQHRKLIQTIAVGEVGSIAVSNDGRLLAIGERGRTTIWQLK